MGKSLMTQVQVKESIDILKKAQEIDRELYGTLHRLEDIPEEKARLDQEFELKKERLRELETAFKKLQLSQKEKEGQLGQKEGQVNKLEGQLSQVKTNKEYSALQQEIASLKADNSLLEEDIIKILDEVEAAEEAVKKERENLKAVEKEFAMLRNELSEKEKKFKENEQRLRQARLEILAKIAPEVRELYDVIVKKKRGMGLAKVYDENCSGCQLALRPQLLNEVRLAQTLVVCENCSRILYFED
ncbi:MAG: hypothetical protein HYZ85_00920 [Candidatus Omnitrophica bacterium]|nr:hypothetical protein [Candidatus Omnitrophota bacterium]